VAAQVIIPEPSFWDPETPFLYQGRVELLQDGRPWFHEQVCHGLRILQLTPRGLRLNGKPLLVRGFAREPTREADTLPLRGAGGNLLLASLVAGELWRLADRLGFMMLGLVAEDGLDELVLPRALRCGSTRLLAEHTSCFGWLLPESALQRGVDWWMAARAPLHAGLPHLLGVELTRAPSLPLPREIAFVVCAEDRLADLKEVHRPKLLLTESAKSPEEEQELLASFPGLLGWIAL
jgi:hypothetical protein